MAFNLPFARILGAAAILAAILLAPAAASAHAGHAHSPATAAQTAAPPVHAHDAEVATAPSLPSMPSDAANCGGFGCCSNAPCSGCLGGVLAAVPAAAPPMLGAPLVPVDAPPGSSPHDSRLRRPPKSFA